MIADFIDVVRHRLESNTQLVLAGVLIASIALLLQPCDKDVESKYPLVGADLSSGLFKGMRLRKQWLIDGPRIITEACRKFPDRIFRLPALGRTCIVLPPQYLAEVKDLPHSIASSVHATSDTMIGEYTTLDLDMFGKASLDVCKMQYISKIGQQLEPVVDEASFAFNKHFGKYEDWTSIQLHPKVLDVISQMASRTILGPDLCRNEEWNPAAINYATNVFTASLALKFVPDFMKPVVSWLTPFTWRIYSYRRTIRRLTRPLIEQKLAEMRDQSETWAAHTKSDLLTSLEWLVELSPPDELTVEMLAHRVAGVSFGATHTTATALTNALLYLAADFERWAPPLREEIEEIIGKDSSNLTNAALAKMWKMDSFLKEAQRLCPMSPLAVNRMMMQDYTLSSGEVLPKGARICFPAGPLSLSEEYFNQPTEFDGFRFEKLRLNPETDHAGLSFTTTYLGSLHFGSGRAMCPGRHFGSMLAKIAMIELLQRFDMKTESGDRPANLQFVDINAPNPNNRVLFRDRQKTS